MVVSGQLGEGCSSQTYLSLLDHPEYAAGAVRAIWNELGGTAWKETYASGQAGFDVVVASNLFGDILSDLGPACAGTIGIAPSANLNPERNFPSLFDLVQVRRTH